ncbi:MAG: VIT1/CCC1 transporter family protein, partial [Spirochaetota bacterium]
MESIPEQVRRQVLRSQRSEITEHHIYARLAEASRDSENSTVLQGIADDELRHYEFWREHTGRDVPPNRLRSFFFFWISRLFGLTFGIKLMERGEEQAEVHYREIARYVPGALEVAAEEDAHEKKLIGLISEERLNYVGSIVLGLNDALVELTGALAGLSLALRDTRLIALAGMITGVAASLSMAASEYLSTKAEGETETALTSALYTGAAYVVTVVLLIVPYLFFAHYLVSLGVT